jgi:hypothetical protein
MPGKSQHKRLLNPARAEEVRQKIRATLLVKSLEDHVLEGKELSASQVTAALGLLKKAVPDLAAVTVGGDPDNPLKHEHEFILRFGD